MGAIFSKEIKSFFNSMLGYNSTYIIFHMDIRGSHIHL